MSSTVISFELNRRQIEVLVKPMTTLQALLRDQLGYTATKSGCKQGGCGSCTVLVNGEPMLSCLLPVEEVSGESVLTLEGLATGNGLDPLQEAFFKTFAIQCGYCTPGMILVAKALLDRNPNPSRGEIAEAISGNYCRCTGYAPIIQAIEEAARSINGQQV